ncbi:MAG: hemerythrin domain-containing protein [Candidatus Thiodiazotropha sp.]
MSTFTSFMRGDHEQCDRRFATAETAVASGDWQQADEAHREFIESIRQHFAMEEVLLFPAFELASGNATGPTAVMRHEHEQMRSLLDEMGQAVAQRDSDAYLGASETLLILMQQHNGKEEQILYPMSDRMLGVEREALLGKMRALGA